MQLRKKLIAVGLTGAFVTGGAAVGLATYNWTSTGTGSATVGATTITNSTALSGSTSNLYPNSPARTLSVSVNNPNPYPVNVTSITLNGHPTAVDAFHAACALTNVTAVDPTATAGVVAPNDSSGASDVSIPAKTSSDGARSYDFTVTMDSAAPASCAGAS